MNFGSLAGTTEIKMQVKKVIVRWKRCRERLRAGGGRPCLATDFTNKCEVWGNDT